MVNIREGQSQRLVHVSSVMFQFAVLTHLKERVSSSTLAELSAEEYFVNVTHIGAIRHLDTRHVESGDRYCALRSSVPTSATPHHSLPPIPSSEQRDLLHVRELSDDLVDVGVKK
jgi:hypothetical protein